MATSLYKLLLLATVVSAGRRTAPHRSASDAFSNDHNADVTTSTVIVDVKSRMTSLGAENRHLKERLMEHDGQMSARRYSAATPDPEVLAQLNQRLNELSKKQVGFHATGLSNLRPTYADVLTQQNILHNQGNGYNLSTGKFTAPVNGNYCFVATLWGNGVGYYVAMHLMLEGKRQLFAETTFGMDGDHDAVLLHAVVDARAGQSVWLQVLFDSEEFSLYPVSHSFSGFLVSNDR